ncbi:DUF2306 domain-containing protein [Alkalilacustris brevis]|uniref:DUF2306 domain-containing protein n=1 Tax=Alkalilacustris brevis TaxID=2026338 RepID=UPI000E0D7A16|nr:DUF2306 domain-containing protein [Alkalilacustris brevis]
MNPDPIIYSTPLIQLHIWAALVAFGIGPFAILRRRRDVWHRVAGHVWVAAMVVTSLTALGIFEIRLIGPFSPIHLLALLVPVMLWRAVAAIRAGRRVQHARTMTQLYIMSMLVAGGFTLLPGRRLNAVLFGGDSWTGFAVAALLLGCLSVWLWRAQPVEQEAARPG